MALTGDTVWACPKCARQNSTDATFCADCGSKRPGVSVSVSGGSRSRLAYILLALFLGGLGVHNFYARRARRGAGQLVLGALAALGWMGVIGSATIWANPSNPTGQFMLAPIALQLVLFVWVVVDIVTVRTTRTGDRLS